jgi:hypothetical protein
MKRNSIYKSLEKRKIILYIYAYEYRNIKCFRKSYKK